MSNVNVESSCNKDIIQRHLIRVYYSKVVSMESAVLTLLLAI